jgi:hypothetical protein
MTATNTHVPKTMKAATEYVGGLSNPSKMAGYAYGIPARSCKTGSKLAKIAGSICSDCYALKGMYTFQVVKDAQTRRLESIDKPYWIPSMIKLINGKHKNSRGGQDTSVFRFHDSGDIQSLSHLLKIVSVVKGTPQVRHWLPTRETAIVIQFLKLGHSIPENMVIRLSAAMVGKMPPAAMQQLKDVPGIAFSGVDLPEEKASICPAPTQGGVCGDCRSCWNRDEKLVSYIKH